MSEWEGERGRLRWAHILGWGGLINGHHSCNRLYDMRQQCHAVFVAHKRKIRIGPWGSPQMHGHNDRREIWIREKYWERINPLKLSAPAHISSYACRLAHRLRWHYMGIETDTQIDIQHLLRFRPERKIEKENSKLPRQTAEPKRDKRVWPDTHT